MRKLFAILGLSLMLIAPRMALASVVTAESTGLTATADAAFGANSLVSPYVFIGTYIIKPIFGLVGLAFFVLTVYAGILWMTARGESKQVTQAKDIMINAVIGTVIVVASYIITTALFNALTTGDVN